MKNKTYAVLFDCGRNFIEFGFYTVDTEEELIRGRIQHVGATMSEVKYTFKRKETFKDYHSVENIASGIKLVQNLIVQNFGKEMLEKIGFCIHRVVHGGDKYYSATLDSPQVRVDITEYNKLAPLHNPYNLQGIIEANHVFPDAKHIICFDTAFYKTLPEIVRRYPLPERLYTQYKIKKYGFHGLSHEYSMLETAYLLKKKPQELNIISIHLGAGASMCAIKKGKAVDISMGFTPTGGLMMTTRCGDIDPEIPIYLQKEGCSATEVEDIILRESGLLGVAQKTFVKDVFENYTKDERCTLAVDMYILRIKRYIGWYYLELDTKVDAITFTGEISTEYPIVRQKVAEELKPIGVKIDKNKNLSLKTDGIFSSKDSKIKLVHVVTNEFVIMLRQAKRLMK